MHALPHVPLQDQDRTYLNNHLSFTILYHKDAETDLARIVGFEVEPYSVQHKYKGEWDAEGTTKLTSCDPDEKKYVTDKGPHQLVSEGKEVRMVQGFGGWEWLIARGHSHLGRLCCFAFTIHFCPAPASRLLPCARAPAAQVIFTYDVAFKASDIRWASRWDTYLLATDDQVHWFSIINSLMIVLFLRCVVRWEVAGASLHIY